MGDRRETPYSARQAPPGAANGPSRGPQVHPFVERRQRDVGPPPGQPDRRAQRRRASDVPKPSCPWCGCSRSAVYRSQKRQFTQADRYRRRRQCADCGRDWPTVEHLDVELFARELAELGLSLEALGLAPLNPEPTTRRSDGDR